MTGGGIANVVNFSLTQPGMAAAFKGCIVLTTGSDAGSDAVTVERP